MAYKNNYISGQKIGELIFLNREPIDPDRPTAKFRCVCGNEFITRIDNALKLRTRSCGCLTQKLIDVTRIKYTAVERIDNGIKIIPNLSIENIQRFWNKVDISPNDEKCWNYIGGNGRYGYFRMGGAM